MLFYWHQNGRAVSSISGITVEIPGFSQGEAIIPPAAGLLPMRNRQRRISKFKPPSPGKP